MFLQYFKNKKFNFKFQISLKFLKIGIMFSKKLWIIVQVWIHLPDTLLMGMSVGQLFHLGIGVSYVHSKEKRCAIYLMSNTRIY